MDTSKLAFVGLAALAGMCIALQATVNGKFRQNLDNPTFAVFFSICGTILCALLALLILRPPVPTIDHFKATQWWNWIGGPLGALIVLAGAMLMPKLGAAAFIAAVVAGQLITSLLVDHFGWLGASVQPITVGRLVGVGLIIAGAICVKNL